MFWLLILYFNFLFSLLIFLLCRLCMCVSVVAALCCEIKSINCLQFHYVKEPSKNHDIWVQVLFRSLRGRVGYGSGSCTFFYFWVRIRFLAKPGFWFGSFLLGSASVPSLNKCPLCSQACNSSGAWCDYLHKTHLFMNCDCTVSSPNSTYRYSCISASLQLLLTLLIAMKMSIRVKKFD